MPVLQQNKDALTKKQKECFEDNRDILRQVLAVHKTGVSTHSLYNRFIEHGAMDKVPLEKMGFRTWAEFLYACRNDIMLGVLRGEDANNPYTKLFAFLSPSVDMSYCENILKLVREQERGKAKKGRDGKTIDPTLRQVNIVSSEYLLDTQRRGPSTSTVPTILPYQPRFQHNSRSNRGGGRGGNRYNSRNDSSNRSNGSAYQSSTTTRSYQFSNPSRNFEPPRLPSSRNKPMNYSSSSSGPPRAPPSRRFIFSSLDVDDDDDEDDNDFDYFGGGGSSAAPPPVPECDWDWGDVVDSNNPKTSAATLPQSFPISTHSTPQTLTRPLLTLASANCSEPKASQQSNSLKSTIAGDVDSNNPKTSASSQSFPISTHSMPQQAFLTRPLLTFASANCSEPKASQQSNSLKSTITGDVVESNNPKTLASTLPQSLISTHSMTQQATLTRPYLTLASANCSEPKASQQSNSLKSAIAPASVNCPEPKAFQSKSPKSIISPQTEILRTVSRVDAPRFYKIPLKKPTGVAADIFKRLTATIDRISEHSSETKGVCGSSTDDLPLKNATCIDNNLNLVTPKKEMEDKQIIVQIEPKSKLTDFEDRVRRLQINNLPSKDENNQMVPVPLMPLKPRSLQVHIGPLLENGTANSGARMSRAGFGRGRKLLDPNVDINGEPIIQIRRDLGMSTDRNSNGLNPFSLHLH